MIVWINAFIHHYPQIRLYVKSGSLQRPSFGQAGMIPLRFVSQICESTLVGKVIFFLSNKTIVSDNKRNLFQQLLNLDSKHRLGLIQEFETEFTLLIY